MAQLRQLQAGYESFKKLDTEILIVHREEKLGAKGIEKTIKKSRAAFPILLDFGKQETAAWSTGTGFHTYIVDKSGVLRKVLEGVKFDRPTAKEIIEALKPVAGK